MNAPAQDTPELLSRGAVPDPHPAAGPQRWGFWIGRGIGIGVTILLAALLIVTVAIPAATGSSVYTIAGRSMEPALPLGSLAVVRPVDFTEITVGEVITFQLEPGRPQVATHRVVGVAAATDGTHRLVTRGDANNAEDAATVRAEQVRGVVWYAIPLVGWISSIVTGEVRSWLVPLAALGLFCYGMWSLVTGVAEWRGSRRLR